MFSLLDQSHWLKKPVHLWKLEISVEYISISVFNSVGRFLDLHVTIFLVCGAKFEPHQARHT